MIGRIGVNRMKSLLPAALEWNFGDAATHNIKFLVGILLRVPWVSQVIRDSEDKPESERQALFVNLINALADERAKGSLLISSAEVGTLIRELALYDVCALRAAKQFYLSMYGQHSFCGPILFIIAQLGSERADLSFLLREAAISRIAIRKMAIRALGYWQFDISIDSLVALAREENDPERREMIFREIASRFGPNGASMLDS